MNFNKAVIAIGLTRQQAFKLPLFRYCNKRRQSGLGFSNNLGVALSRSQLDQVNRIGHFTLQGSNRLNLTFELVLFPHNILCHRLIIPEISGCRLRFQISKPILCVIKIDMLAQQF